MLADLPRELIGSVLMHLGNPTDVRSLLTSCKALAVDARDYGTYLDWKVKHHGVASAVDFAFSRNDTVTALRLFARLSKRDRELCFRKAVDTDNANAVRALVPLVNVNARFADQNTALHLAVYHSRLEIVKILVHAPGINVNLKNRWGSPAVDDAYDMAVMNLLLRAPNANVNIRGWHGRTPLYNAVMRDKNPARSVILAMPGIDVNIADDQGLTPLHVAVRRRNSSAVRALLGAPGINVNTVCFKESTPLHDAVIASSVKIVSMLLAMPGVNANPIMPYNDDDDVTPLHIAAAQGSEGTVSALLASHHVNVNAQDYYGQSPLFLAVCKKHTGVVAKLVASPGIDVEVANTSGQTPLDAAIILSLGDEIRAMLTPAAH